MGGGHHDDRGVLRADAAGVSDSKCTAIQFPADRAPAKSDLCRVCGHCGVAVPRFYSPDKPMVGAVSPPGSDCRYSAVSAGIFFRAAAAVDEKNLATHCANRAG